MNTGGFLVVPNLGRMVLLPTELERQAGCSANCVLHTMPVFLKQMDSKYYLEYNCYHFSKQYIYVQYLLYICVAMIKITY
jgi:hypothetical protein